MLNENAKKWVAALRSGDYKQTHRLLRDLNGYCCLGVACDLYGKEKGLNWQNDNSFIGENAFLPLDVQTWLNLKNASGLYDVNEYLTNDNDCGRSFQEIADIIEREQEGLFKEEEN